MRHAHRQDTDLDDLIAEITIDCYDEDEQLQGFENAFDEDATLPCPGTVVGEQVDVLHIGQADNRRELVATCRRDGRTHQVALLDVHLHADPATARLLAAYRGRIGA